MKNTIHNPINNEEKNNLLSQLGLSSLSEEEKKDILSKLAEALQNRITLKIMDSLSDEQRVEMNKVIAQGDDNKVNEYIKSSVPHLDSLVRDEYEKFKSELLAENQALQEIVKKHQVKTSENN